MLLDARTYVLPGPSGCNCKDRPAGPGGIAVIPAHLTGVCVEGACVGMQKQLITVKLYRRGITACYALEALIA